MEENNPKENKLRVSRGVEDTFRDHMVALTYMNSAQFGQGIDVTPGHPVVNGEDIETESSRLPVEEIKQRLEAATSQVDVTSFMEVDTEPELQEQRIESPPPLSIVPMELPEDQPTVTGFTVEEVGLQEDVPQPAPPQEPEVYDIPASAIPPPPEAPPVESVTPFSVTVEDAAGFQMEPSVDVEQPPIPDVISGNFTEPEPLKDPDVAPAFPFLQGPEFKIDPAYEQNQHDKDMETYVPDGMSLAGLDELQLSSREYMQTLNRVIFGMVEDLKDFRSRLIEIETVYDRRYFRHGK